MDEFTHQPVLLEESVDALAIDKNGIYIDCTFGRGGHSGEILKRLESGRLLAFDRDLQAIEKANSLYGKDQRFSIVHSAFGRLYEVVNENALVEKVAGILLDLGVSSTQLDDARRGFSVMQDGPLDMRMDQTQRLTAADWLQRATEKEIRDVLHNYGEERFSSRIASSIVKHQYQEKITTTSQLVNIINRAVLKKEKRLHPATRSFQAIRIQINDELKELQRVLDAAVRVLKSGGRLAVISFHSLEDRQVKQFIREKSGNRQLPKGLPITAKQALSQARLKLIGKLIRASAKEIEHNPRARSARLRVAEKV